MFGLGIPELLIILVILVLIFGARKLPELGKSLGSGIREFRKGTKDDETEVQRVEVKPSETPRPGDRA